MMSFMSFRLFLLCVFFFYRLISVFVWRCFSALESFSVKLPHSPGRGFQMWEFGFLWVWMGTPVVSLIPFQPRSCYSPFSVSFGFFFLFVCLFVSLSQLLFSVFTVFLSYISVFIFSFLISVSWFALAKRMFALHFFSFISCLVWLKLVSLFQENNIFIQTVIE